MKPHHISYFLLGCIVLDRIFFITNYNITPIYVGSELTIGFVALFVIAIFLARSYAIWLYYLSLLFELADGFSQILYSTNILDIVLILSGVFAVMISILGLLIREPIATSISRDIFFEAPQTEYAVIVDNVHKIYEVGEIKVHALRGISLKIKRGEFVAIMGPSGTGKSTLLNMIGALDKPTSGKVYIDGVDITQLNDDQLAELRNKKIGFVFQSYNLINRTPVIRNVEMPSIVADMPKKKRINRALELLKIMGLTENDARRRPVFLSGGQQQRVAIARALMNNPTILLADEPTGNLDSKTGEEVMKYFRMLNEKYGVTVILVTHDRGVAEKADRILHIKDGVIVREEILGEKNEEK